MNSIEATVDALMPIVRRAVTAAVRDVLGEATCPTCGDDTRRTAQALELERIRPTPPPHTRSRPA